ncbi:hypothetical protein ANN_00150 [Periplaneta americana]|uniref:Mos1 transposase HTH domain-containing protein n=1 Tax=Periplaneta americana TaxID=6978 RepID=A0ABQ8TT51_PERAM|nr:hypothetical protein ANN_00150 [Periplaneta americana]
MSPGSNTESYPAFAHIGLRENPGKNLNQEKEMEELRQKYEAERKLRLQLEVSDELLPWLHLQSVHSLGQSKEKELRELRKELQAKEEKLKKMGKELLAERQKEANDLKLMKKRKRNWLSPWLRRNYILKDALKEWYLGEEFGTEEDINRGQPIRGGPPAWGLGEGLTTHHRKKQLVTNSYSKLSKNLKVRIYKTVILPVLLYGCETWTLTLREEHRLRVFDNKVLRKIFGAKRDEVTGEWSKLHNTELHALYSSPDIIRNLKSRRLRWAGHVARMGESRNAYRVLVGRPEGKRPLGRPRRRWEDNIKMDLREVGYDDRDWLNLAQDRDRWRAYVRAAMNLREYADIVHVYGLCDGNATAAVLAYQARFPNRRIPSAQSYVEELAKLRQEQEMRRQQDEGKEEELRKLKEELQAKKEKEHLRMFKGLGTAYSSKIFGNIQHFFPPLLYLVKGKGIPVTCHEGTWGGMEVESHAFHDLGTRMRWCGRHHALTAFYPRERPGTQFYRRLSESWGHSGSLAMRKNPVTTWDLTPDLSVHSQLLYQLSYPATHCILYNNENCGNNILGGRVAQLVEQLTTDWKVRGSIPGGDRIFSRCQTFRTAPRFTQPPIKLSTGSFPGVKGGQSVVPTTPPHSSAEVMESMGLYLHAPQVPSWHVTGIPLPLPIVSTGCNKSPLCILCYFKMNDVIDNPADCEVRSVIRFLNARHLKPAEIYRQLKEVYGDTVMNERNVRKWCEMFNNGRTNVHDETRPGRPSLITEDLKTKVNDRILQDKRTSLDELHIAFPDISRSLLVEIVSQHLGYHKICARWVPRQLSDQHKTQRMASALTFLMRYHTDGDTFLDQIVTGDGTWVSHNTPETKLQSRQWHHPSSPKKPRKFKQILSTQKVMATVFWDRKGVLLLDFMPKLHYDQCKSLL